jgi:hypothetical protein
MSDPYAQVPNEPAPPTGSTAPSAAQPGVPWSPPSGYSPQEQRTNGFAIAALVFGILSGIVLAVIFGIIALVQIPKKNQKGKGLAIAGLILAGVWTFFWAVLIAAIVVTSADRDASGEITESGDVSAFSLEVGDCLNDVDENQEITTLPAVPCDQPHEAEVVGMFDLPEGDYPTEDELVNQAEAGCSEQLAAYAPDAMTDPTIGIAYIYPLEPSWPQDREIVCFAVSTSGPTTGSILN